MLIEAMKCSRPFVKLVMLRLQSFVEQQLKSKGIDSDCSTGHHVFDDGPTELKVTGFTPEGVFFAETPHGFCDDQRLHDPCAIYFKNVPPCLQAAGIEEGVKM